MINFFLDLDLVKIEAILFKKERIFYERKRKKVNAVRDHNFKKFRAQTPREKNGRGGEKKLERVYPFGKTNFHDAGSKEISIKG